MFNVELDIVRQEIERLTAEVNRLRAEYDLDDGVNDDAEQAEIDELEMAIQDLRERQELLEAGDAGMLPHVDSTPVVELDTINITASEQIDYHADELQQFFGTRVGGWAGRCGAAILGARTELNVQVPDEGFSTNNLFDVFRVLPMVGQYAAVTRAVFNLLTATIETINVRPGTSFADIGNELSTLWINFQGQMERDSSQRRELYDQFVTAFRGNDPDNLVPRDLIRREIESYVARMTEPTLVAREFLLRCFECLDDPLIELDPFYEPDGYETGDVTLHFRYRSERFGFYGGYIDDAPGALVDALRRNFGESTRCVDLPLAMRVSIVVSYRDYGDDDDDDETLDMVDTRILARRRSRTPGNEGFDFSLVGGMSRYERRAEEAARDAFLQEKPYLHISLGQLRGD